MKVNKIFRISALVQTLVITLYIINYALTPSISPYKQEKKLLIAYTSSFFDFKDIYSINF
ncbi:hypothetical protein EMIT0180MI3_340110 [Priestia megaterium]